MRHIKLTISYDGTKYCGWQVQPNGVTIQELLQKAVNEMTGEKNNVVGAGRTDARVHALAQVAAFRTEKEIALHGFRRGLNSLLPPDIRVLNVQEVSQDFHPIRDSKAKYYRYVITVGEFESPLHLNRSWCISKAPDIEKMRGVLPDLIGEHDFKAFAAADDCSKDSVRTIFEVEISESNKSGCLIDISGNGFLKNMVRNIVGTLVGVGLGKISSAEFKKILDLKDRKKAGVCAPASGLYLVSVDY